MRPAFGVLAMVLSGSLALAGCQTQNAYTDEYQTSNATRGALIGAGSGAVLGALTNTRGGQAGRNALIGAGIGALAGGVIGNYMDRQEEDLRRRLRTTGVRVTRRGDNLVLNMEESILFETNSADVRPRARDVLHSVALVLKEYRSTYVDVNGYADTAGSSEYNLDLSQDRAERVADMLVYEGIEPARISPRGFGETHLAVPTPDGVSEPRNRRVEIVLLPFTD